MAFRSYLFSLKSYCIRLRRFGPNIFFISALLVPRLLFAQAEPIRWVQLGEDLEFADFTDNSNSAIFQPHLTLIRSSLKRYRVNVLRAEELGRARASVAFLCSSTKSVVCINANFFDENGRALGLVASHGVILQKTHKGGKTLNGIFVVSRNGLRIGNRDSVNTETTLEAVQAGPILISSGTVLQGIRESAPASRRSGVCIDKDGRVIFFLAWAGFFGVSIERLQQILTSPGIDCQDALNLDGGGSSQLFVNSNLPAKAANISNFSIPGQDDVPVALALSAQ